MLHMFMNHVLIRTVKEYSLLLRLVNQDHTHFKLIKLHKEHTLVISNIILDTQLLKFH